MNLKKWQKIQLSCNYNIKDTITHFGNCNKTNSKCCYNNCPLKDTLPLISCGNNKNDKGVNDNLGVNGLTIQETIALRLRNKEGLSYANIGCSMGISKTRAFKLIQNAIKKVGKVPQETRVNGCKKDIKNGVNDKLGGLTKIRSKRITKKQHRVNLHNDSISIECTADLSQAKGEKKQLKYTYYKFIKTEDHIIKIFEKKLVIQFRKDIEALTIKEVYNKATKRIETFINNFFMEGVFINKEIKQLSRHYALIGTEIAKKYIKEGKKLFIYDQYDGKERVRIDFSDKDKAGGLPHYEFTHPIKSKDDSDKNKQYIESIINYDHYLPHQTKSILDTILSTQNEYAYQIRRHLEVQTETLKTLKAIQENLNKNH